MLKPEKVQSCLSATLLFSHGCHLIKYVTVLQYFVFFILF